MSKTLFTNKEYIFISKRGKIYIQSSKVEIDHSSKAPFGKVWTFVQNYIETKSARKKKISVKEFNKMKLSFIAEI